MSTQARQVATEWQPCEMFGLGTWFSQTGIQVLRRFPMPPSEPLPARGDCPLGPFRDVRVVLVQAVAVLPPCFVLRAVRLCAGSAIRSSAEPWNGGSPLKDYRDRNVAQLLK